MIETDGGSISALLTVAMSDGGRDTASQQADFATEVLKQVEFLKAQLQSGTDGSMAASWQQGVRVESSGGFGRAAMSHPMPPMRIIRGSGGNFFPA